MTKNPYQILQITENATSQEIEDSYVRLAKLNHPDLIFGKQNSTNNFLEIFSAYDYLTNKNKAKKRTFYSELAGKDNNNKYNKNTCPLNDLEAIKNLHQRFIKGGVAGESAGYKKRPNDDYYTIKIEFIEACIGCKKRITKPNGKIFDLTIPSGIKDGQVIKLSKAGNKGIDDQEIGDAFVEILVIPHPYFRRDNFDIHVDCQIQFDVVIIGGKVQVPTIHGPLIVSVPANSNSGTRLRVKNKGILKHEGHEFGDLYINLIIVIPNNISDEVKLSIAKWSKENRPLIENDKPVYH